MAKSGRMRRAVSWAALCIAAAPSVAIAEEPAQITVLAEPLPSAPGANAYSVEVLNRSDLLRDGGGRLDQVLQQSAGFQLFRRSDSRSAHPTAQGPTLRALGGNGAGRALVLLDGVPQEDPFGGWVAWNVLTPERLEWARITRGGGAGAFGAGALAGTIELTSRTLEARTAAWVRGEYGSFDSALAAGSVQTPVGSGVISLSGQAERSDGFYLVGKDQRGPVDVPARHKSWNVEARGAVPLAGGQELTVRVLGFQDRRINGLELAPNRTDGIDASVRLVSREAWAWEALAYAKVRTFESGFTAVRDGRRTVTPSLDQYDVPATGLGFKAEARPPVGEEHTLQLGVDGRWATGETRELFRFMNGAFTRQREAGGDSLVAGAYVEHSWQVSSEVLLTGGVRVDHWRLSDGHREERDTASGAATLRQNFAGRDDWRMSGRAGVNWKPWQALDVRAAVYNSYRVPTLNELYRPFRVGNDITEANPELKPERLQGGELGLRYQPIKAVGVELTVFANSVHDAVGNTTIGTGPGNFPVVGFVPEGGVLRQRRNIDRVRSRGAELSGHVSIGPWLVEGSYAFTDAEIRKAAQSPALVGLELPQSPRHAAFARISYEQTGRWGASFSGRYVGRVFEDDLNNRTLSDSFTMNGTAWVMLRPGLKLQVRGENLADVEVEAGRTADNLVTLAAPRTVWASLTWDLLPR